MERPSQGLFNVRAFVMHFPHLSSVLTHNDRRYTSMYDSEHTPASKPTMLSSPLGCQAARLSHERSPSGLLVGMRCYAPSYQAVLGQSKARYSNGNQKCACLGRCGLPSLIIARRRSAAGI